MAGRRSEKVWKGAKILSKIPLAQRKSTSSKGMVRARPYSITLKKK
jgi:hypothetical protein